MRRPASRRPATPPQRSRAKRWAEPLLFRVLPLLMIVLIVFTPFGQDLLIKAAEFAGQQGAETIQDGFPTEPSPRTPSPG